jgi:hypothetical protein
VAPEKRAEGESEFFSPEILINFFPQKIFPRSQNFDLGSLLVFEPQPRRQLFE